MTSVRKTSGMQLYKKSRYMSSHSYEAYVAHYGNTFRSAIEYRYEEKPRQVFAGVALLLFLIWAAFYTQQSSYIRTHENGDPRITLSSNALTSGHKCESKPGQISVGTDCPQTFDLTHELRRIAVILYFVICIYCFLQTKDGLHVRPHPGFWRVVHATSLFYFLFLVILLLLTPNAGRALVGILFPSIQEARKISGIQLFAGTLETQCELNVTTIRRQLETPWFLSHVFGWLLKMCVYRNWAFCLIYSALFEFSELSLQWLVPEFRECWWDSVILDFLFANVLGMILGAYCLRILHCHKHHLFGDSFYKTTLVRFSPFSWSPYKWDFFGSPSKFFHTTIILTVSNLAEINVFLCMSALNIPASHYINPCRCLLLCLLGSAAVSEHYEYINSSGARLGHNFWLCWVIIFIEDILYVKYNYAQLAQSRPSRDVAWCWSLSLLLLFIWFVLFFYVVEPSKKKSRHQTSRSSIEQKVRLTKKYLKTSTMSDPDEEPIKPYPIKIKQKSKKNQFSYIFSSVSQWAARVNPLFCFTPLITLFKFYLV